MTHDASDKRLRVGGDILAHSIVRQGNEVHFTLIQNAATLCQQHPDQCGGKDLTLNVVYSGSEPLPDTFKDGSQALADGKMDASGVFLATKVQAKCASKYEAKPGDAAAMRKV
jgi:cytochrome c-type biogenesis protein CcmE